MNFLTPLFGQVSKSLIRFIGCKHDGEPSFLALMLTRGVGSLTITRVALEWVTRFPNRKKCMLRSLTALPVFNEVKSVDAVLNEVNRYSQHVLVVDDGSSDGTLALLQKRSDVYLEVHEQNRGYGAALDTAFKFAAKNDFDIVVTIDCDGQHEPQRIPHFVEVCSNDDIDIVSGSRYLKKYEHDSEPPAQRRLINQVITGEINEQLCLNLTDAFCGFKAYRVSALRKLELTEPGYAMPLELWVQAAAADLTIVEIPVPLIYLDEKRSFGGVLDNGETRLKYYREVLAQSIARVSGDLVSRRTSNCGQEA